MMTNNDCIFCLKNKEHDYLMETKHFFIVLDKYPVTRYHTLIISKRHVESYFELTDIEKQDLDKAILKAKEYIDSFINPTGYNIGINIGVDAGQTIMHLHVHLIPRTYQDTIDPKGGVRGVIPNKQKY